ncbi:MAG: hydrogenase expression/formation protein, partial [Deltaproteobacteria bacterium]|nr:hydrogenase expression/formation protein [Deltaproteobacteria bacterium]
MVKKLPLGKLNFDILENLLKKYPGVVDERLVVGPKVGEDAAIIDFPDRYLVAKTDPITFAMDEIGWYAVHINANDIAIRGAKPRWFQSAILLPEGSATQDLVEEIFGQISRACRELGVAIVGGHTEITYELNRPIVVGSMFGEVEKEKLVTTSGA